MRRLAIVGSRTYPRLADVDAFVLKLKPTTIVVSGGAAGVDRRAAEAARRRGLGVEEFFPDWDRYLNLAGLIRNEKMVDAVDGLAAFWDLQSSGTRHSIKLAKERGIWLLVYGPDGEIVERFEPNPATT